MTLGALRRCERVAQRVRVDVRASGALPIVVEHKRRHLAFGAPLLVFVILLDFAFQLSSIT